MKRKTSLKDIARKVGVSTALVSYVLNNKKQDRISKEVAQKIREAAKELNYSPNQLAKSLKTSRTHTLGLIVADIANPFFSALARIIEDEAETNGYTVLFGSSDESAEKSWKLLNVFLDRQVDGLIIASAEHTEEHIRYLQEQEVPFVLIDRYFPELPTNYVTINNYQAAATAVKHLSSNGYRRIGLITFNTSLYNLQERKQGYLAALQEEHIPGNPAWIKELPLDLPPKAVEEAIRDLLSLEEPVDAILFTTNVLSTSGLKYLNHQPVKVPDNLAVASFDESDASYLFYAPVTHIRQPLKEIGQQALTLLLASIRKKQKPAQLVLEAQLVPAKSTAPVTSQQA